MLTRECRCFKELHPVFFRQLLSFFERDDSIIVEIALVGDEHDIATGWSTRFNVSHPSNDVIKGGSIGNIVRQTKAVGSTKEIAC